MGRRGRFRRICPVSGQNDALERRFRREAGSYGCVYAVHIDPERVDFSDAGFMGVIKEWMDWVGSELECEPVYEFVCEGNDDGGKRLHAHGMISVGGKIDENVLEFEEMEDRMAELLGCGCIVRVNIRYAREVRDSLGYAFKGSHSMERRLSR